MKTITRNFRRTLDIAKDWDVFSLDEVKLDEQNSFVDGPFGSCLKTSDYTESGIPVIQLNNIGIGEFIPNEMNFTSEEKFEELKRAQIFPGDIIIAKMAEPVARCCIVPELYDRYLISADCIKLKVNLENFSPEFIANMINSTPIMNLTFSFATGTTRLRINLTDLKKICIPCPTNKTEQEDIADIFSEIEKKIRKQTQLIKSLKNLKQGLMRKLFSEGINKEKTHEIELGRKFIKSNIPQSWKLKQLRKIATVHGRIGWKNLRADEYVELGPLMLSVWSLNEEKNIYGVDYTKGIKRLSQFRYDESPEIQLKTNDILVAKDGDIGRIGFVDKLKEPTTVNSHVVVIRFFDDEIDPEFLYYYFQHQLFQKYCIAFTSGTTVPLLSQENLKDVLLPIPDFDEQVEIKLIIKNNSKLIFKENQYLQNILEVKKGLMQQLLIGQKRVKI